MGRTSAPLLAALALALAPIAAAGATLADLAGGGTVSTGNGVLLSNFDVRVRGRKMPGLDAIELVPVGDGFALVGPGGQDVRGSIRLRYTATASRLVGALLAVDVAPERGLVISASQKLKDGLRRIDMLKVRAKTGKTSDSAVFASLTSLSVDERIRLRGDVFAGPGNSALHHVLEGPTIIPEPGLTSLLAGGLAALGLLRRRARA